MATVTASMYAAPPSFLHAGVNYRYGTYTSTLSTGEVLKVFKVPHGARVLKAHYDRDGGGGDVTVRLRTYSAGGSSTTSAGIELITSTASGALDTAFKSYQVSCPDSAVNRYVDVEAVVASASATGTHRFWIMYGQS